MDQVTTSSFTSPLFLDRAIVQSDPLFRWHLRSSRVELALPPAIFSESTNNRVKERTMPIEIKVAPPGSTISQGRTFMVTNSAGEINPQTDEGVFAGDTRFIGYYHLFINRE